MASNNSLGLVNVNWSWTSNADGTWSNEMIQSAAAVVTARQLIRIGDILGRIEVLIISLGRDGLHDVIRHEAERVRKLERLARARAKAARARAKAAKLAALDEKGGGA